MDFCNWDNRPAVLDGNWAFAVVKPGGPWLSVDRDDVRNSAGIMSEEAWRKRFFGEFGWLDLSKIPGQNGSGRSIP